MKIYIASKFEEKDLIRQMMYSIVQAGHAISYDWTRATQNNEEQALRDCQGVKEADIFLGIFERDYIYRGAIAELGMAIALNKRIYIVGNKLDSMIFIKLSNITRLNSFVEFMEIL